MNLAFELSKRSTCDRLQVGCVVTSEDYSTVYGIGYNGNAKGLSNSCTRDEPGNCGCLHAEENALLKVNVNPSTPKIVFCTHQPCEYCAKRLINKGGVVKVYYSIPYRSKLGIKLLQRSNIVVLKINS